MGLDKVHVEQEQYFFKCLVLTESFFLGVWQNLIDTVDAGLFVTPLCVDSYCGYYFNSGWMRQKVENYADGDRKP